MDSKTDYSAEVARLQEMRDRDIYMRPPSPSIVGLTWRDAYFEERYKVDALRARLTKLEGVAKYAEHNSHCNKVKHPHADGGIFGKCDCGLDAALAELEKERK